MENTFLSIQNLHARVAEKEILKGLNLEIGAGEIHVIMGPNAGGKSTLANVLMGHPQYEVTAGDIIFQGQSVNELKTHHRARRGLFLAFQYPEEISGISLENFLYTAKKTVSEDTIALAEFQKELREKMQLLEMDEKYGQRYLNENFSGGEKKKSEILQMLVLEPKLAILDETDSGLDVDAVRIVAAGVGQYHNAHNSILIITHHRSLLDHVQADQVHLLIGGQIIQSGTQDLMAEIEKSGFAAYKN